MRIIEAHFFVRFHYKSYMKDLSMRDKGCSLSGHGFSVCGTIFTQFSH